jgi:hypothetical protein
MMMASSLLFPQTYFAGVKSLQTFGRAGSSNIAQLKSGNSCIQDTPAGLPFGIPGIGELIDGAVQHAPQLGLHNIILFSLNEVVMITSKLSI